jgi:hypothetical protein
VPRPPGISDILHNRPDPVDTGYQPSGPLKTGAQLMADLKKPRGEAKDPRRLGKWRPA